MKRNNILDTEENKKRVYPVARLDRVEDSLKQTYASMLSLMKLIEEQQKEIEALHERLKAVESKVHSLE